MVCKAQFIPLKFANRAVSQRPESPVSPGLACDSSVQSNTKSHAGLLIVNADDWGRDHDTTERTLECVRRSSVSSVSAMVFMEDSESAAATAQEHGIDAGLHLNFTTPFSVNGTSAQLIAHQQRLSQYLRRNRYARAVFHPRLIG